MAISQCTTSLTLIPAFIQSIAIYNRRKFASSLCRDVAVCALPLSWQKAGLPESTANRTATRESGEVVGPSNVTCYSKFKGAGRSRQKRLPRGIV
jgi:predicted CoA-binding protein